MISLRYLAWLRFLLIVPLVRAFRRKTRQSLRWRLIGSHLTIVLLSVFAIVIVGVVIALLFARNEVPAGGEVALEAWDTAQLLEAIDERRDLSDAERSALLIALATGELSRNEFREDITFGATIGRHFDDIRSISYVAPDGTIRSSSDPALIGSNAAMIDPAAAAVVAAARTETDYADADDLGLRRSDGNGYVGAYQVTDATGAITAYVLIDKSRRSLPGGWGLILLAFEFIAQVGLLILVLVGIPAIPIGIIVGIRRGRAISRPITDLAKTTEQFAGGDLAARVVVKGQDEIAGLQRHFNEMAELLQQTMATEAEERARTEELLAANRRLIANVSHELRTPVALIRGHLEAIDAEEAEPDPYIRIALRETDRLERLVEDLFQLSRLETQRLDLDLAPFDAGPAVREAVESLVEPARREAGLALSAEIEAGDLTAVGDRLRFEQVLHNLIRNAIHYTPEGGIVLVSACEEGDRVAIVVRDTGVGIAPEDLPQVFDRFYRADRSRNRSSGGAGLGLAIAREMVEAMGGTIAVESVVDEGSCFTISLPRAARTATNGQVGVGQTSPDVAESRYASSQT